MNDANKQLNIVIEWGKANEAFQEAQVLKEKQLTTAPNLFSLSMTPPNACKRSANFYLLRRII